MLFDINKLIESEYEPLKQFGHLLYESLLKANDLSLNEEQVYKLLQIFNEESLREIEKDAYQDGYEKALELFQI